MTDRSGPPLGSDIFQAWLRNTLHAGDATTIAGRMAAAKAVLTTVRSTLENHSLDDTRLPASWLLINELTAALEAGSPGVLLSILQDAIDELERVEENAPAYWAVLAHDLKVALWYLAPRVGIRSETLVPTDLDLQRRRAQTNLRRGQQEAGLETSRGKQDTRRAEKEWAVNESATVSLKHQTRPTLSAVAQVVAQRYLKLRQEKALPESLNGIEERMKKRHIPRSRELQYLTRRFADLLRPHRPTVSLRRIRPATKLTKR